MLQTSYRGLTNFVTEVRDCKTSESEKERVVKELEKVQSTLAEAKNKPYDRIKSILKLLYIQTLGYDISSFESYCLSMARSPNYSEKRVGYLTFPIFLGYRATTEESIVRILQEDLTSSDVNIKCMALGTLSNLSPRKVNSRAIIDSIKPLLVQKSPRELCQRALCCLSVLCSTETGWNFVTSQEAANLLRQFLKEKDPGLVTSFMSFLHKLVSVAKDVGQLNIFTYLLPELFQTLTWLLSSSFDASSYTYYQIPCPFLISDIWKIIGLFPASVIIEIDRRSKSPISSLFLKCLSFIQKGDNSNRRNVSFAVALESLRVVSKLPLSRDLFTHTLTLIMSLISEDVRPTTRYFVLRSLIELSFLPETWTNIQSNYNILLPSTNTEDESTECVSLWFQLSVELLSAVCNTYNVEEVLDQILRISSMFPLPIAQQRFVMDKCLYITRHFLENEEKLLDAFTILIGVCQDTEVGEITNVFLSQLQRSDWLQRKSMQKFLQLLQNGSQLEAGLLQFVLLVFPMYSYELISSGECNAVDVLKLLYGQICSYEKYSNLQSSFLTFIMKWGQHYPETVAVAVNILKSYAKSQELEVQTRACEYLKLLSLRRDDQ